MDGEGDHLVLDPDTIWTMHLVLDPDPILTNLVLDPDPKRWLFHKITTATSLGP